MVLPTPVSVARFAENSVPKESGRVKPATDLLVLLVVIWYTRTVAAEKDVASRGPPKRMRIGAVVDQPSSALIPTWFGIRPLAGWMLSVPSVVPEKYRSLGHGKMPCA